MLRCLSPLPCTALHTRSLNLGDHHVFCYMIRISEKFLPLPQTDLLDGFRIRQDFAHWTQDTKHAPRQPQCKPLPPLATRNKTPHMHKAGSISPSSPHPLSDVPQAKPCKQIQSGTLRRFSSCNLWYKTKIKLLLCNENVQSVCILFMAIFDLIFFCFPNYYANFLPTTISNFYLLLCFRFWFLNYFGNLTNKSSFNFVFNFPLWFLFIKF